jgi:hypothetical protein
MANSRHGRARRSGQWSSNSSTAGSVTNIALHRRLAAKTQATIAYRAADGRAT